MPPKPALQAPSQQARPPFPPQPSCVSSWKSQLPLGPSPFSAMSPAPHSAPPGSIYRAWTLLGAPRVSSLNVSPRQCWGSGRCCPRPSGDTKAQGLRVAGWPRLTHTQAGTTNRRKLPAGVHLCKFAGLRVRRRSDCDVETQGTAMPPEHPVEHNLSTRGYSRHLKWGSQSAEPGGLRGWMSKRDFPGGQGKPTEPALDSSRNLACLSFPTPVPPFPTVDQRGPATWSGHLPG